MTASTVTRPYTFALALAVAGLLMLAGPRADATSTHLTGESPRSVAIAASATVPSQSAEVVLLVSETDPQLHASAAAILGGVMGGSVALLTPGDHLPLEVMDELERVAVPNGVVMPLGGFRQAVVDELVAGGWAVIDVPAGSDVTATAIAAAVATYGVPVGTDRRVIVVSDEPSGQSAAAGIVGINLGVPVVPVTSTPDLLAPVAEVVAVADPSGPVVDAVAGIGDLIGTTQIWDADPSATSVALLDFLEGDSRDGDLLGPSVISPIVVSQADAVALTIPAATLASQWANQGHVAALLILDGDADGDPAVACAAGNDAGCRIAEADGERWSLALVDPGTDDAGQADASQGSGVPLPTTGGGLALLGAALALAGFGTSRRG